MNYMWDDLVSVCTTTPATPAHSVQQRERCPGRVCHRASRDTYDSEVCHEGEILYSGQRQQIKGKGRNTGGREGRGKEISHPRATHRHLQSSTARSAST